MRDGYACRAISRMWPVCKPATSPTLVSQIQRYLSELKLLAIGVQGNILCRGLPRFVLERLLCVLTNAVAGNGAVSYLSS